MNSRNGFTLVELSIVMIVIGLLIGAVLKGQELIEGARIKMLVSNIQKIEAATWTFYDMYRGEPGDLRNATDLIPGCTADNFCQNGDGNGYLGSDGGDRYVNNSPIINHYPDFPETIQFWKHLALADLISGVSAGADPSAPEFGLTHPASFNGGLEMYHDGNMLIYVQGRDTGDNIIRTSSYSALKGQTNERTISPVRGFKIDKIMDNGVPNSGKVIANYGSVADTTCKVNSGSDVIYASNTNTTCNLYIRQFKFSN